MISFEDVSVTYPDEDRPALDQVDLKIGEKVVPLAPGKTVDLNLPEGTRIVADNDTPNHASGTLIEQVISSHGGATISIH